MLSPGVTAFRLRPIPPLARPPEEIEVIVTGSSIRVRAILRCPAYPENAGHLGLDTLLRPKAEDSNYSPASEEASS